MRIPRIVGIPDCGIAKPPQVIDDKRSFGAGNEARTRDLNLGKVALYQLSYSRPQQPGNCRAVARGVKDNAAREAAKVLNLTGILPRGARTGRLASTASLRYSRALPRSSGHARRRYKIIDHNV